MQSPLSAGLVSVLGLHTPLLAGLVSGPIGLQTPLYAGLVWSRFTTTTTLSLPPTSGFGGCGARGCAGAHDWARESRGVLRYPTSPAGRIDGLRAACASNPPAVASLFFPL